MSAGSGDLAKALDNLNKAIEEVIAVACAHTATETLRRLSEEGRLK